MKRLAAAMVLVVWAASAAAWGQDEPAAVDLRPRWREGQRSRYELWNRRVRDTTMTLAGRTRSVQVTIETLGEMTWTVDRVQASGGATCTMTLDWMTMTIQSSEGEQQHVDTRRGAGDNELVHDLLTAMAGVPIAVTVAPDGTIQGVRGVEAIRRRCKFPEMAPSELDFIESASDLAALPGVPAAAEVGDRWHADHRWSHEVGTLSQRVEYSLVGMEELAEIPLATVTGQGKLSLDVDRSKMPPDAPPIDVRLVNGQTSTQVMFDLLRREAVGRNSTQQMTIDVTIRLPQQTITQRTVESVQGQVLRISEQ